MSLNPGLLHSLTMGTADDAWRDIIDNVIEITSKPLTRENAESEVTRRDREIGTLDLYLGSIGWDLWNAFGSSVERTSNRLARWWTESHGAKAVLILDGLSLRELPWLLQGANERGFSIREFGANASELPGETNEFARALGFGSRSQLQNNGGGKTHRLQPTQTECVELPWEDCGALINSSPNWLFWHQWPDSKVHDGSGAGQGLETLTRDAVNQLDSASFWEFIERLATGRRLVITSDHGYAATGYFPDADGDVGNFLKKTFASGRSVSGTHEVAPFIPPVALQINNSHGSHLLALGRRKWRSHGGYPTLTHGGLSLLEVLSPFVELTK